MINFLLVHAFCCITKIRALFGRRTVVVVGGSAGTRIATEIFRRDGSVHVVLLEPYASIESWGRAKEPYTLTGTIDENISLLKKNTVDYFVATGDNKLRKSILMKLQGILRKTPINCIHHTAFISKTASIGYGNLILANSVIHTNAKIGVGTIINSASVIEHDAEVHDFAQIAPAAVLGGRVIIHELAFVGLGAQILPEISVGENSVVAAGATVIRNVDANTMVAGCPAVMKKKRD